MGIIHPSLVSSQQSVQSYHSGIMDGRHQGKVYWLPRLFFSPTHCSACICFALLHLGACLQACFFFFFFKQLVTVLSVSYMHFRGICVKTERADYYCTYTYCILKSETVVICCSMYLLPLVPQWFHSHQFSASWPLVPHLIWYFSFRLL